MAAALQPMLLPLLASNNLGTNHSGEAGPTPTTAAPGSQLRRWTVDTSGLHVRPSLDHCRCGSVHAPVADGLLCPLRGGAQTLTLKPVCRHGFRGTSAPGAMPAAATTAAAAAASAAGSARGRARLWQSPGTWRAASRSVCHTVWWLTTARQTCVSPKRAHQRHRKGGQT